MKEIQINELTDFKIGHAQDETGGTGCTVILCEKGAVAGRRIGSYRKSNKYRGIRRRRGCAAVCLR